MLKFPLKTDTTRKIVHIDMDAFFASVEQRDDPSLQGKAVIIARNPLESGGRGVVSTCSYEARKFGVHSAMSAKEAYDLCPQAIFISGNYDKYRAVSHQVREIFQRYTDLVQMASIDEAYLDVTQNKIKSHSALKIAKLIQYDIWTELHLTCSAGVSYNKFLAKIASDWEKPHGLTLIKPEDAKEFLANLAIEKFFGVGKATVPKLHALGIFTGADIQKQDPVDLAARFGVYGWDLYLKSHGISNSRVETERVRKSLGKERTFTDLLKTEEDVKLESEKIASCVSAELQKYKLRGNTIVLKIRYSDFETLTKRRMTAYAFNDIDTLLHEVNELLEAIKNYDRGIRLLGVTVTGLESANKSELQLLDRE